MPSGIWLLPLKVQLQLCSPWTATVLQPRGGDSWGVGAEWQPPKDILS